MPPELEPRSIAVVLGTRPEVVKLAGVIRQLGDAARVIHTGQHFDDKLSRVFFDDLGIGPPGEQFAVGGSARGAQVGEAVAALERAFEGTTPRAVVVQGDTNAVLAAAVAANAREVPLVHVEAGLRSFDRRMPEEHNRVVADHLADLCLAPTGVNVANLAAEGIDGARVELTGNTVVEAVRDLVPPAPERAGILASHGLSPAGFVLSTLHRPENVDDPAILTELLEVLGALPLPVVLPVHPRTAARVEEFGLGRLLDRLHTVPPAGYREFLGLLAEATFAVSDSGGVQEEVSVLGQVVVVVRRSTERPEVLGTFADLVEPGPAFEAVVHRWAADDAVTRKRVAGVPSPYGDGTATRRVVDAIVRLVSGGGAAN